MVVVGLATDNVLIWDDEQGTVREVANERFFRDWSGYVLSTGTRGFDRLVGAILVVEITCFCILCGFWLTLGSAVGAFGQCIPLNGASRVIAAFSRTALARLTLSRVSSGILAIDC